MKTISIVVPAYNESRNIPRLVEELDRLIESKSNWINTPPTHTFR